MSNDYTCDCFVTEYPLVFKYKQMVYKHVVSGFMSKHFLLIVGLEYQNVIYIHLLRKILHMLTFLSRL